VSKKYALTAPYYIYYIAFRSHDIPKLRASHWIPSFPHSAREIWRAPALSPFLRSRRRRRRKKKKKSGTMHMFPADAHAETHG